MGDPAFFEKRCSAHGEHASVLHRGVSRATSLKMHVGPTPSGHTPSPAKNSQMAGGVPKQWVGPVAAVGAGLALPEKDVENRGREKAIGKQ